jgi:hypothetical protein
MCRVWFDEFLYLKPVAVSFPNAISFAHSLISFVLCIPHAVPALQSIHRLHLHAQPIRRWWQDPAVRATLSEAVPAHSRAGDAAHGQPSVSARRF